MYEVKNFGTGEVWRTPDVKFAYRVADGMYRATPTMVTLRNTVTGKTLFNRCHNDFALDQWIDYMDGKSSIYDETLSSEGTI